MAHPRFKSLLDATTGAITVALIRAVKWFDRKRTANFAGAVVRKLGPLFKEHRLGRENLRAAFPEKSDAEIERILTGVWDNLGRMAVEFAHLDEFSLQGFGTPTADVVTYAPETLAHYHDIVNSAKSTITFAAHLANWELSGLVAKLVGFKSAVLYRRPNNKAVSDAVIKLRAPLMGELVPTTLDAPVKLARLLQSGVHVGMVADQHYSRGVEVTFFGRRCLANPLVALLARQTGCAIHGIRLVRLPDGNSFWGELTEPIATVRDADGRIDIQGTTQAIMTMIERWVREHPEQWLWLHRRWR
ncbi:MAG TPA: lipid A biosynthesis lauroyl acyltransferase [Xanthobacteraceae bacterium]|jgi:KDO2-lipid IV(A) lauroyltransferase|nr:lipid A biosynthesis lauroyl acyltransferase [Xanthobacteraceae bacterium]